MRVLSYLTKLNWLIFMLAGIGLVLLSLVAIKPFPTEAFAGNKVYLPVVQNGNPYVVLGWNDLGMHCYDRDYSTLMVLPPYNNLYAQVIKRGDPPQVITTGITVEYSVPGNTYSAGKTNFWDYVFKLLGVNPAPNIGLTGKGLAGLMDPSSDHFVAQGIPVTEFPDNALTTPNYFQLAHFIVKDLAGNVLAQTDATIPVSSEMRCDKCHNTPSPTNYRMNILQKHDEDQGTVMSLQAAAGNPAVCSRCHADPVLGMPGNPNLPSLSAAVHGLHAEQTTDCYSCHPGPVTRCLRDVMSTQFGLTCVNCHVGGMTALANQNRTPWVDLPRCGNCHPAAFSENPGTLYKLSKGHGGLFCESCHNSTHAITTSREANDNVQAITLQGYAGPIGKCTVCHLTQPTSGGPHQ